MFSLTGYFSGFRLPQDVGVETFVLAGMLALVIALGTVSFQAIKSALANPVDSFVLV
jgi:hypothetical protein